MKLLFDQNLSFRLCTHLADLFPGSQQVRIVGLAEATDRAIWDYAKANGFAIASLDADFLDMAAFLGAPPKLIWLRPTAVIEKLFRDRAQTIGTFEQDDASCLEIY